VKLVTAAELSQVWPRVSAWIESAVKANQGDENLLDVLIAIARGQYLLFEGDTYAVVGQVQVYPQQKVGMILYCGGSGLNPIQTAFEDAKHWCSANGISVLRTFGRPGWAKVLGLEQVGVILQTKI
jgi:alkanesulfonate monooxygenase SsuD/methylene tetrahydromethanopterin reductase-like flavin-dependent oxidoreductase (luciferase family)